MKSLVLLAAVLLALVPAIAARADSPPSLVIRVVGNHFVDQTGHPIRLLGVNRSGSEYECMDGKGVFDGPSDAASIDALAAWHVNAVRVPINEDCWLGINGAPSADAGANYQSAIEDYVQALNAAGLYAIVDLHWNAPGKLPANGVTGQGRSMPDRDHALTLWHSLAVTFRNDPAVLFDLYNEPHDVSWDCWQNGCTVSDSSGSWQGVGMQQLVNTVRATGAKNPILLAGNRWAQDIRGWPHGVRDPLGQLAASWHVYAPGSRLDALRDLFVRPLAGNYPVVASEIGQKDCGHDWLDSFVSWADRVGISYLAWTWNTTPDCSSSPLVTSYDGTATQYGAGYQDHLAGLWRAGFPTTVLSPLQAETPLLEVAAATLVLIVIVAAVTAGWLLKRRRKKALLTAAA